MKRVIGRLIFVFVSGLFRICLSSDPAVAPAGSDGWKLDSQSGNIALYSRLRPNSSLREFKAVGEIDASIRTVHTVIDDVENYSSFMPYTVECRIVKRESGSILFYQRLSPKIVSDRDYTLRVHEKSWRGQNGVVFLHRFEAANEFGPAEQKNFTRVKVCNGGWLLEPAAGSNKTNATYSIDTDNGGKIPAFIANPASEIGIRKLFAAVRQQVKDPKYKATDR